MKRLDQGHLHPLPEHHDTNMSRPEIKTGVARRLLRRRALCQRTSRTAYTIAIRNFYLSRPEPLLNQKNNMKNALLENSCI
jgi:hypothetical protein